MSAAQIRSKGVLGKGPLFWGAMVFLTTALVLILAFSRAIEGHAILLLTLVPCALAMVMFRAGYKAADDPDINCGTKGEAQKRYIKRTAIFTSIYLVTFGLLIYSDRAFSISSEAKFALALLPGLSIIGIFWTIGRLIVEEKDEFMRMLVVRQTLVASGFALSAATAWGFLESTDLVVHIDAYWWAVAFFFGLFIGAVINRVQYGTWGAV